MMNKTTLIAAASFLAIMTGTAASIALAGQKPIDYRRTLFVPVGQKTLVFEAPKDMCFLDMTAPYEEAMYKAFQSVMQKNGDQSLLAVFADCTSIANLTDPEQTNQIPLNAGIVSWLNQPVGETTTLTRPDYLDMRESAFPQYVRNSPTYSPHFRLDKAPHRTPYSVSLSMEGDVTVDFEKQKGSVMLAATTIRDIPIECMIRYTGKEPPPAETTYQLMDKFIAQQITLNE